jgi:diketogulonate reductase-like aldo/keto reductase
MHEMETITLDTGVEIPALGLGVFQTPGREARGGGRCARCRRIPAHRHCGGLRQPRQVGEAVHASDLNRADVFLETKIWISDYGYDETLHGFEKSARKLGDDHIDLLILHQALPSVRPDPRGIPSPRVPAC